MVPSRDLMFTIRALGRTSGGGQFVRQAVIALTASEDRPFLVHDWSRAPLPDIAG